MAIDFSQYSTWEKVVAPGGQVYYKVPGSTYLYDPFLSQAKGRPVIFADPRKDIEKADKEKKKAEAKNSPLAQAAPIAGTVGGVVLANQAINTLSPDKVSQLGPNNTVLWESGKITDAAGNPVATSANVTNQAGQAASNTSAAAASAGSTPVVATTVPTSTTEAFTQSAAPQGGSTAIDVSGTDVASSVSNGGNGMSTPSGVYPLEQMADGSVRMSNGAVVKPGDTPPPGFNWIQGAGGALQLVSAAQMWKEGDELGAGIMGASGAASIGTALGNQTAAQALPILGPIAGIYGGYQTAKMTGSMPAGGRRNTNSAIGGASSGAAIGGSVGGPVGAGIGAVIGATVGLLGSIFGSSKDKYQMMRDQARKVLQANGILDENYQGTLADGTKFDFGKDGKTHGKLNTSDPNWGKIAALANVIAATEGATGKAGEALATLYTNAALSNAGGDINKAIANIQHFARQRGFNLQNIQGQLDKLKEEKKITDDQYSTWSADKGKLFTGAPAQQPGQFAPAKPQNQPQQQQQTQQQQGQPMQTTPTTQAFVQNAAPNFQPQQQAQPGQDQQIDTSGFVNYGGQPQQQAVVQPGTPQSSIAIANALGLQKLVQPQQPAQPQQQPVQQPIAAQPQKPLIVEAPKRSQTLSPGIGLDGRRLSAEEMGRMLADRRNRSAR